MREPEVAGDKVTVTYLLLGLKSLKLEGDIIPLKPISSGADPPPFPHPSELGSACLPTPGSGAPANGLPLPFLLHLCFQKTPVTVRKRNVLRSTRVRVERGLPALCFAQRGRSPHLVHHQHPLNHHKSKQESPSTEGCSRKSASTTPPSRVTQRAQPCRALATHLLLVPLPPADIPVGFIAPQPGLQLLPETG